MKYKPVHAEDSSPAATYRVFLFHDLGLDRQRSACFSFSPFQLSSQSLPNPPGQEVASFLCFSLFRKECHFVEFYDHIDKDYLMIFQVEER